MFEVYLMNLIKHDYMIDAYSHKKAFQFILLEKQFFIQREVVKIYSKKALKNR